MNWFSSSFIKCTHPLSLRISMVFPILLPTEKWSYISMARTLGRFSISSSTIPSIATTSPSTKLTRCTIVAKTRGLLKLGSVSQTSLKCSVSAGKCSLSPRYAASNISNALYPIDMDVSGTKSVLCCLQFTSTRIGPPIYYSFLPFLFMIRIKIISTWLNPHFISSASKHFVAYLNTFLLPVGVCALIISVAKYTNCALLVHGRLSYRHNAATLCSPFLETMSIAYSVPITDSCMSYIRHDNIYGVQTKIVKWKRAS